MNSPIEGIGYRIAEAARKLGFESYHEVLIGRFYLEDVSATLEQAKSWDDELPVAARLDSSGGLTPIEDRVAIKLLLTPKRTRRALIVVVGNLAASAATLFLCRADWVIGQRESRMMFHKGETISPEHREQIDPANMELVHMPTAPEEEEAMIREMIAALFGRPAQRIEKSLRGMEIDQYIKQPAFTASTRALLIRASQQKPFPAASLATNFAWSVSFELNKSPHDVWLDSSECQALGFFDEIWG